MPTLPLFCIIRLSSIWGNVLSTKAHLTTSFAQERMCNLVSSQKKEPTVWFLFICMTAKLFHFEFLGSVAFLYLSFMVTRMRELFEFCF